ncbi:MAG: SURF1 family protein [Gemmatimonadota bacterium]
MSGMATRYWLFTLVALALAALFVRLGFWQVGRLAERGAENAWRAERLALPPITLEANASPPRADSLFWRRLRLDGEYEFDRELIVRGRSHRGVPGIHVLTPLRRTRGPAVVVLRGWLPAADGLHAKLSDGRPARAHRATGESRPPRVRGSAEQRRPTSGGAPTGTPAGPPDTAIGIALPSRRRETAPPPGKVEVEGDEHVVLGVLDLADVDAALPYPIAGFYLQVTDAAGAGLPRPLPEPALDRGPHLAYAIQWFSFAAIVLVGTGAYLRRVA